MSQSIYLSAVLVVLLVSTQQTDATSSNQRLFKRQSEQENTTPTSNGISQQAPARLYPDLPRPPTVAFVPPFGANNNNNHPNANHQAPFVPFAGVPMPSPNGRLQLEPQTPPFRSPQPFRHMTPLERLQSQTFTSGLGRRLLSMIGINTSSPSNNETMATASNETVASGGGAMNQPGGINMDETMRALQNSTILRQLNSGVHSIYGSLSRMYNSTVQQQLDLLQERYKMAASNSTDPWQQRMAAQVPQFFRSMAMKVNEAQENLNRVLRQVAQASNNTGGNMGSNMPQNMNTRTNDFDSMVMNDAPMFDMNNGFLSHIGRSFGFGPESMSADPQGNPQRQDLTSKLMEFWHHQVQPQMGMVRGQVMRIWRDLTTSGAFRPTALGGGSRARDDMNTSSPDIVDDVLKDVEMNNEPEFKLVESRVGNEPGGQQQSRPNQVIPQLQNGMVNMQRELNQLWNGLTHSLQNALNMVSARRSGMKPMDGNNSNITETVDPAENEISDKLKDLSKIQRDADVVYDTVQRQQQAQQRTSFADRFRNFFNNIDLGNMDQLGNRIGDSVSRFGNVLGDMWN